jgi:hypothetical protein
MFFQLLYIHTFRPFLKYSQQTSPLPPNVSPRRLCTQAAASISKLLRLYKRSHGLRQVPNLVVYIAHSACTIHLLNLPDKNAKRDITHGAKHLEEMAEGWLCARRTLAILSMLSRKWKVGLPEEAATVFCRTDEKFGAWNGETQVKSPSEKAMSTPPTAQQILPNTVYTTQPDPTMITAGSGPDIVRRINSPTSMAPQSGAELQRARLPTHTRASSATSPPAARISYDSNITQGNDSPSGLFGGVEQLLRESQDWWLRDQSQLAMGFEQWPMSEGEMASWLGAGTTSSAVNGTNFTVSSGLEGVNGFTTLNQYPDEHEWYL